ncbi:MAG: porin [Candidatus Dadabacteria bacterium]
MKKIYSSEKLDKQKSKYFHSALGFMLAILGFFLTAIPLQAQSQYVTPDGEGDITFTPGLRIQTRYEYNEVDKNNDFYINRLRLKGGGKFFSAGKYYFEVKIDGVGKFNKTPKAQIENAWMNFNVAKSINLRAGLYDFVFSRDALTSDSKLLLMDRSLIKDALAVLGFADNTVGLLLHGRPLDGHLSYGFGVFDNLGFETGAVDTTVLARKSNGALTAGRLVYDFLDPAKADGYGDYWGSYIGQGQRLSVGGNAAYLTEAENLLISPTKYTIYAVGGDVFFNTGPITVQAEYDMYKQDTDSDSTDIEGSGWYAQAGYLFLPKVEFAVRYQELDPNTNVSGNKLTWTTVGINYYWHSQKLKIAADYTFKKEETNEFDNNVFQIQLQLDF